MNAVQFPNMLSNNQTQIVFDYEATLQNLTYLILSQKRHYLVILILGQILKS